MASAMLKRPATMKSVAGSLRMAASSLRAYASISVGTDLVSSAPDVSLQKARTWDVGVASKFSTTLLKDIFKDKKVVIFGLPGAYTGVCSTQHVPSYKNNIDKFKAKGIDHVICVAVNDPYVLNGWAEKLQAKELLRSRPQGSRQYKALFEDNPVPKWCVSKFLRSGIALGGFRYLYGNDNIKKQKNCLEGMPPVVIEFYGDFDGSFHKSLELGIDLSAALLGHRSHRWSAYVVDGKVKVLNVEKTPAEFKVSGGDVILGQI